MSLLAAAPVRPVWAEEPCRSFTRDRIMLSGHQYLLAKVVNAVVLDEDSPDRTIFLELAQPFELTQDCRLGIAPDRPTRIEARLEKTEGGESFTIKTQNLLLASGYALPICLESEEIRFEHYTLEGEAHVNDHGLCDVVKLIPGLAMDSEVGGSSAQLDQFLTSGTRMACRMMFTESVRRRRLVLEAGRLQVFHLDGAQSIAIPPALRNYRTVTSQTGTLEI